MRSLLTFQDPADSRGAGALDQSTEGVALTFTLTGLSEPRARLTAALLKLFDPDAGPVDALLIKLAWCASGQPLLTTFILEVAVERRFADLCVGAALALGAERDADGHGLKVAAEPLGALALGATRLVKARHGATHFAHGAWQADEPLFTDGAFWGESARFSGARRFDALLGHP